MPPFSWSVSQTSTTDISLSFVFHLPFTPPLYLPSLVFHFPPKSIAHISFWNDLAISYHWCISADISPPHQDWYYSLPSLSSSHCDLFQLRFPVLASVQRRGWCCWASESCWWSTARIASLPQHWCYQFPKLWHSNTSNIPIYFIFNVTELYLHP